MATLTTQNLSDANRLVIEGFLSGQETYTPQGTKMFKETSPERKDEKTSITAGAGGATEVAEGAPFTSGAVVEVGGQTYTQRTFKDSIPITTLMDHFSQQNLRTVVREATKLGYNYSIKTDDVMAEVFRNAFISTGAHGITIDSTANPLVGATQTIGNTGQTQNSLVTGELSDATLNDALTKLMQFFDHNDKNMPLIPSWALVAPARRKKLLELLDSQGNPEAANRNINTYKDMAIEPIVWPLLTNVSTDAGNDDTDNDTIAELEDNWFVGAGKTVTQLWYFPAIKPRMRQIRDQDTGNRVFQIEMAVVAGAGDYLGIVGSEG